MYTRAVPVSSLNKICDLVPYDVYLELEKATAVAIVAMPDDADAESPEKALGALVYTRSPYSEISKVPEILIDSIFVKEEYRCMGVGSYLLRSFEEGVSSKGLVRGISVNFNIPEQKRVAELFIRNGYSHRADGNRIYRISRKEIFKEPEIKQLLYAIDSCDVISFDKAPNTLMNDLYSRFGKEIPEYLSPHYYGGKPQKDLSFVTLQDEKISFVATSLYPKGELFLGGLYVSNHNGYTVAALLGNLIKGIFFRSDITSVLITAANEDSDKIVKQIFKHEEGIKPCQVVTNYYKEMNGEE